MKRAEKQKKGSKILKILGFILLAVVILLIAVMLFLLNQAKRNSEAWAENQAAMVKTDDELLGEHFYVLRQDMEAVDVNLYLPENGENLPVVFNLHGGAFIAGDADTLDSQSAMVLWNMKPPCGKLGFKPKSKNMTVPSTAFWRKTIQSMTPCPQGQPANPRSRRLWPGKRSAT